ncbi:flagellar basal-body rod protein FlgB [Neokomagataea thailandica NBRC 106555]|uniref:Flagellar basal body rod protein FlgB n=2 Tax=Neokomagataea TaxID=1223423 RepID=A0A4Y6V6S4_9PROT|nr:MULTISPECIES: flagellar basal body protein [Neokomagataea]QDH25084.1 flagellar biosynthesis protein FlgB [Neokomagataea tanensis]GBR54176.1 flagellar basal-body rod protein FlgB [Neokomagataea thailandica NBRC 106555]
MKNIDTTAQSGTDIFALGQQRLQWLQTRQQVLAGNIANANTPDYAARDVSPFEASLSQFDVTPVATHAGHIGASASATSGQSIATEESLDHNGVALDQQMEKVAEVNDQQHFAVNLYGKYMSMFQTVLGK